MAKRKLIIWCSAMVIALCTLTALAPGCTAESASANSSDENLNSDTMLLDLFYGMNQDSTGVYCDSVLDNIPGLIHKEYARKWLMPNDTAWFEISMGIYLDEEFPNEIVRETVLTMVDTILPHTFEEDIESAQIDALSRRVINKQSSTDFLDSWERVFDELTRINGYGPQYEHYGEIPGSRGCTVCHLVYEDANWATYIIEFSFDYHITRGCPSKASYYTINKSTGYVLTISDILAQHDCSEIGELLVETYKYEVSQAGFTPVYFTGEELISTADGVAIINNGILFYYHPYNIGGGAEGQYNLFILP